MKTTILVRVMLSLMPRCVNRHRADCWRDTNTHPGHAHDLKTTILVRVMLHLMPRCVAGTEMIAGGTPTRTLVMYMVVLGLNAPVGVAIGQIIQQI